MTKRSWKIYWLLFAAGSLTWFIKPSIAYGFIFGGLICALLYRLDEMYVDAALKNRKMKLRYLLHSLLNFALMASPLLAAGMYPDIFNIFAAFAGLMLLKITVVVEALTERT